MQLYCFVGFLMYYADCMLVFRMTIYVMASGSAVSHEVRSSSGDPAFFHHLRLRYAHVVLVDGVRLRGRRLDYRQVRPGVSVRRRKPGRDVVPSAGYVHMFVFYSLREVFIAWMLFFAAYKYITTEDDRLRLRLSRFPKFYVLLWFCSACGGGRKRLGIAADRPGHVDLPGLLPGTQLRREPACLVCEFVALRSSLTNTFPYAIANLRKGGDQVETYIDHNLVPYAASLLTPRETEILRLVLLGKDNQNIAAELSLAPGTVKVHVHNILKKSQKANRQELIQDYWEYGRSSAYPCSSNRSYAWRRPASGNHQNP